MRFSGNGCQPCRNSRKKCDGIRPACCRCVRTRKICYGYREAFSIVHAENVYASGRRKRPKGPRPRAEPAAYISPNLPRDIQSEAVARYMRYHLAPLDGRSTLEGSIREAILSALVSNQGLEFALSSVSVAIFSKIKQQPLAATQASISYQCSLRSLQATLSEICYANVDTCLLTILFLARYEDSIYNPSMNHQLTRLHTPSSNLHLVGATACLEYWFKCPGNIRAPTYVITHARRNLRKAALLGQFDMPDWLRDGALFGEYGSELQLDHILVRLIHFRRRISLVLESETASIPFSAQILSTLEALCKEASAVDEALIKWMNFLPSGASYTKHKLASARVWSRNSFYHPYVYASGDHVQAATRVQWYGYRILTNILLIRILEFIGGHPGDPSSVESLKYRHTMKYLAHDMASSIPFSLGRFTVRDDPGPFGDYITVAADPQTEPYVAELVATPLVIASTAKYMDVAYTSWFRSQLANIGRLTGYGLIEYVATSHWFKL